MRLRSEIKTPQWYETEPECLTGGHPRLPRSAGARKKQTTRYVEYNPHLPPAVFPTLNQPLPAGQTPLPARREDGISEARDLALDPFPHIPSENFDNFIASNGPQNPQYRRNMALLDKEPSSEIEISSDEDEDVNDGGTPTRSAAINDKHDDEGQTLPDNPQWHQVSLALQIEIAENMLEVHGDLHRIRNLLGLNQCDIEELASNLHRQNEDLDYENRVLEDMQTKQHNALMRLDNSDLKKHSVPAQLIMSRKSWNQCHRAVRRKSKSRMRYLLCQAGDLQIARSFLSRRGLSMKYAGEWDNQYVANPSVSDYEGVPEAFQWRQATYPSTFQPATSEVNNPAHKGIAESVGQSSDGKGTQAIDDNNVVDVDLTPSQSQIDRHISPSSPGKGVHGHCSQAEQPRQSLVRLRIGATNAAQIQINIPTVASYRHLTDIASRSLPQLMTEDPDSDDTIEQSPPKPHRLFPIQGHFQLPVRRKLGCWSTEISRAPKSRFVPPQTAESSEALEKVPAFESIIDNQGSHRDRQISNFLSEQIYGGYIMGSMSAFDDRAPKSSPVASSGHGMDGRMLQLVPASPSVGGELEHLERANATYLIPQGPSELLTSQLQQNTTQEYSSPFVLNEENEIEQLPQTVNFNELCQPDPSDPQPQPISDDKIAAPDEAEAAVAEETKEELTKSPIPTPESDKPASCEAAVENQAKGATKKGRRGRPSKKRSAGNISPPTEPTVQSKRSRKSTASETFFSDRVLRDRSNMKKESKR